MILERKLNFPSEIHLSNEAKDLIDRLLQLDPFSRLGAGRPDSDFSYASLKAHPFFNSVDFKHLNSLTVPLSVKPPSDLIPAPSLSPSTPPQLDDGPIVFEGELKKKNKYFWNQIRNFVLLRKGQIEYYKDKTLLRGIIPLTKDTKVVRTAKDKFEVITPTRTY